MSRTPSRPRRPQAPASRPAGRAPRWAEWPDDRLLDLRMCDLRVTLEGTWVEDCVEHVREELAARGLRVRPHAWLSQEWFSPDRVPGIAVPFYLVHPRLMRLERRQMLEVEGGSREECLRILRHEFGHAVQHAFRLERRAKWKKLFGRSAKPYPASYRPDPASRSYVQHLRQYYAQSHPDEDFAETFAVWLQPRSQWRRRYAEWPALRKLEYVDELMAELAGATPPVRSRRLVEPLTRLRVTLREHYAERQRQYSVTYPSVYDRDLRRIFSDAFRARRGATLASKFLRQNRGEIRRLVSRVTGERPFTIDQVLSDLIGRCRELGLVADGSPRRMRVEFAVLLTAKTVHALHTRPNWIAL